RKTTGELTARHSCLDCDLCLAKYYLVFHASERYRSTLHLTSSPIAPSTKAPHWSSAPKRRWQSLTRQTALTGALPAQSQLANPPGRVFPRNESVAPASGLPLQGICN